MGVLLAYFYSARACPIPWCLLRPEEGIRSLGLELQVVVSCQVGAGILHLGPLWRLVSSLNHWTILQSYRVFCLFVCFLVFVSFLETGPQTSPAGFDLTIYVRMTWNFWSFCLYLSRAGIIGLCHHIQCRSAGARSQDFLHSQQALG